MPTLDYIARALPKMLCCELQLQVLEECLQLHGGAGYTWEYPMSRAYADTRVVAIGGGVVEVIRQIIARAMFRPSK